MDNTHDHGLFQEIEEDLQRQKVEALWKKYGPFLLGTALVIVLATAAFSGWKTYATNRRQKDTAALVSIVETAKKEEKIARYEEFVKKKDGTVQAVLARFYAAEAALAEGKKERAITFYDALADDKDVEPVFRGLADVLSVLTQIDDGNAAALEARLKPLMNGGAWHSLAQELSGHLAVREGDKEKAKRIFAELLGRKDLTPGIQRRAADMYQWLNGGV